MIKRHMPQYDTLEEADDGDYVLFTDHDSAIAAKDAEIVNLHRLLAAAELDALTAWNRHATANSLLQTTCKQLEEANTRCQSIEGK